MNVKAMLLILFLAGAMGGCTAQYEVSSSQTPPSGKLSVIELNERLKEHKVNIESVSGRIDTVTHVVVERDVTRAIVASTKVPFQIPTRSITRVSYVSGMGGFLEGSLLGAVGGGIFGMGATYIIFPPRGGSGGDLYGLGILLGGLAGGTLGLISGGAYGAIQGKQNVFDLQPSEQWADIQAKVDSPSVRADSVTAAINDTVHFKMGPVANVPTASGPAATSLSDLMPSARWWGTAGGGLIGNLDNQSSWGFAYQPGEWIFSIRNYSGKSYSFALSQSDDIPEESEWQFMAGRSAGGEFYRLSISAGLSIVDGKITNFGDGSSKDFVAVGIPLEVRGIVKFTHYLGIGLCAFYNYNPHFSSSGVLVVVEIGRL